MRAAIRLETLRLADELKVPLNGWRTKDGSYSLRRGRDLLAERLAETLQSAPGVEGLLHQIDAFDGLEWANTRTVEGYPLYDPALALAVGFRESENLIVSSGYQSIETYNGGGLDFIGYHLPRARELLPPGMGRTWNERPVRTNPESKRSVRPADVPGAELFAAYVVELALRRQRFLELAREHGFLPGAMSPLALRAWSQIFFGGRGGTSFSEYRNDPTAIPGLDFGGRTLIEWLAYLRDSGNSDAQSLDHVLENQEFRVFNRVKRGLITAIEATAVHNVLFSAGAQFDACLIGRWRLDNDSFAQWYDELRRQLRRGATPVQVAGTITRVWSKDGSLLDSYEDFITEDSLGAANYRTVMSGSTEAAAWLGRNRSLCVHVTNQSMRGTTYAWNDAGDQFQTPMNTLYRDRALHWWNGPYDCTDSTLILPPIPGSSFGLKFSRIGMPD